MAAVQKVPFAYGNVKIYSKEYHVEHGIDGYKALFIKCFQVRDLPVALVEDTARDHEKDVDQCVSDAAVGVLIEQFWKRRFSETVKMEQHYAQSTDCPYEIY